MNFEEIVNAQEGSVHHDQTSFGTLQREQIDKKYCQVLAVRKSLADRRDFQAALENAQRQTIGLRLKQQLHFQQGQDEKGGLRLELEPGSYQTFAQLLNLNPAVVAKSGFVDNVVEQLCVLLSQLHEQGIYAACLSPQNVLIRKGDEMPMMMLYGSQFATLRDWQDAIYGAQKDYLAPELQEEASPSAASDVYSLGMLIEWLFQQGDMPYEYKKIVSKAKQTDPSQRYESVEAMKADLTKMRMRKRSLFSFVGALLVVLLCFGLYFELMPEAEDIEFVDPAPKETEEDPFGETFDPEESLLNEEADSTDTIDGDTVTLAERKMIDVYMKKAEDIYRKQFRTEADRILSKVYNNERMNASEKSFMASSNAMRDELIKVQNELAVHAGISDDRAGRIATEVIDQLTREKTEALDKYTNPKHQKK
ncbi:MAG: hypothetical protein IJ081_08400 [Prevotella sp.]|nr:hypothetical protein [Prevotella sp.]